MIDSTLRARVAPYFDSTHNPTLRGVLRYLCTVNSDIQEGEVWEPTDPHMIAIQAYLDEVPAGKDPFGFLEGDIESVRRLLRRMGDLPLM